VEDWVKARYQLMVFYAVVLVINLTAHLIRAVFAGGSAETSLGTAMGLLALLGQIITV